MVWHTLSGSIGSWCMVKSRQTAEQTTHNNCHVCADVYLEGHLLRSWACALVYPTCPCFLIPSGTVPTTDFNPLRMRQQWAAAKDVLEAAHQAFRQQCRKEPIALPQGGCDTT